MDLPPIVLSDETHSIVEILRAIAVKELSLTTYAASELNKIQTLLKKIENINEVHSSDFEICNLNEIKQRCIFNAQTIQLRQQVLVSSLQKILQFMNIEELYHLSPLPANCVCKLSAHGQGKVTCRDDCFFNGMACIKKLAMTSCNEQLEGSFQYQVSGGFQRQEFEAVTSGLKIDFLHPHMKDDKLPKPDVAVLTGYGVTAKHDEYADKTTRGLAWFALTIWSSRRKKANQFRIVIASNNKADLNHDSGIVK